MFNKLTFWTSNHWAAATAGDAKCLFQQQCLSIKITETVPSFLIITVCDRQGRGTYSLWNPSLPLPPVQALGASLKSSRLHPVCRPCHPALWNGASYGAHQKNQRKLEIKKKKRFKNKNSIYVSQMGSLEQETDRYLSWLPKQSPLPFQQRHGPSVKPPEIN